MRLPEGGGGREAGGEERRGKIRKCKEKRRQLAGKGAGQGWGRSKGRKFVELEE